MSEHWFALTFAFSTAILAIAVLVLACTVPLVWWKALKLDNRVDVLQKEVATLDETLGELAEAVGVKAGKPT